MKNPDSPYNRKPIILVVDDTLTGQRALTSALAEEEYQLALASNGNEALSLAHKLDPDVILLDVMMPDLTGYEVCRQIRSSPSLGEVPILLVTSLTNREDRLKGIASGADDFISKPFDAVELSARIRTITRLNRYRKLKERTRQLTSMKRELAALENTKDHLHKLAMVDDLTRLHNRRSLLKNGREEFSRARRYNAELSVLMIDFDNFKEINDTFGHEAGNHILMGLATVFQNNLRSMDIAGRLGGDEFFILLPHTSFTAALALAERLRKIMASQMFTIKRKTLSVTISIGVAALASDMESITELMEAADIALYKAKTKRNHVA